MVHYRASRAFSTASSLAESSEFVTRHAPAIKLMGSVLVGAIAATAYITSLLGKRDLALKEESTKQALADLAESTKRELALKEESTRRALALMEEAAQRALALKEESTQRALADLEERRQREVDEQRARVETLERVFGISYHSDWTGLREK